MWNRSVPVDGMLAHVSYRNVAEAMAWLTRVFGFEEHYRYGVDGDRVNGAQMPLGEAYVMLRTRVGRLRRSLGLARSR
ncbi:MAG TPA: hypothetical protein VF865_13500 [Acidobacteriaceae bacterium]